MKKVPFVTLQQVQEIAKQYPTPFHIYDEQGIRVTARALKQAFAWNKGFREYFAVKATPNPFILSILKEEGCGVDCSSYTELLLANECGFHNDDIMFSSNETPLHEFSLAKQLGAYINLDDYTHIDFLEQLGPFPRTICLRFNPGGDFTIGTKIMGNPSEAKYGMTRQQILSAVGRLHHKGVEEFGLHAFLASNTVTNDYYPTLAGVLFDLAAEIYAKTKVKVSFINLSGGIGIPYDPDQKPNDILAIGEGVRQKYEEILSPIGLDEIKIFTELGRFMLGPNGALITKVIHFKHTHREYVGVDACSAHLMRPMMYGAYHHIAVLGKEDAVCDHLYDVVGSLCENTDKFAINRWLPEIEHGDYLYIHDTGAHGHAMGYNYNGRLRSAELLLRSDGAVEMIRRAETPKDLFATLDFHGSPYCGLATN